MKKILASLSAFALVGIMLAVINQPSNSCVNVYVDYGSLDNNAKTTKCIEVDGDTVALDVLRMANLEIEGTQQYGLSVVCRVNNLPTPDVETCETMPPAEAYWAIIIKERQIVPLMISEWGWGQVAVDEQILRPGDSVGLVFADNGEVRFP